MSNNNSGRYLEDELENKVFKTITDVKFRYARLPDSKSARGLIAAQASDFRYCSNGQGAHVECKSTGSKTLRLSAFAQHAEMTAWAKAGMSGYVLVHFHKPNVFCLVDVLHDIPIGKPSWDLKKVPKFATVREAMFGLLGHYYE